MQKDYDLGFAYAQNFINMNEDDSASVLRWRNSFEVSRWMFTAHKISLEEHEAFIKGLAQNSSAFYWVVKSGGKGLGVISINGFNRDFGSAYLGIYANPENGEKGRGAILMNSLLHIAFAEFGLETLKLEVIASNEKAVSFYERNGFAHEGRLRGFAVHGGVREDVIIMGIMRDEALKIISGSERNK